MKTNLKNLVVSFWMLTTLCFLTETVVVRAQTAPRHVPANTNQSYKVPAPPPLPSESLINCTGVPDPGNTLSTSNPVCANVEFTLSLQNSGGSGVTYQWQANTGAGFVDIAGATDATLVITEAVGTNYQCIVTCTGSGLFATSSNLLVAVRSEER